MHGFPQHRCNVHDHLNLHSPTLIADAQKTAIDYVRECGIPLVIKADGLAAGKGVIIARHESEAVDAWFDAIHKGREAAVTVLQSRALPQPVGAFMVVYFGCSPVFNPLDSKSIVNSKSSSCISY